MAKGRDDALLALLPPVGSPYSYDSLSEAETEALEEALGDGFGARGPGSRPLSLPPETDSGLLHHSFFVPNLPESDQEEKSESDHKEECAPVESDERFWYNVDEDEDQPAPFEVLPLDFNVRRLRLYFDNQLNRFREQLAREKPEHASLSRGDLEPLARYRLYEKPWYEFHALELLEYIRLRRLDAVKRDASSREWVNFCGLMILSFSGQLGRLVEQYYWRFRFEKAAVTGIGARKGASLSGKLKSERDKALQADWQRRASDIWGRRPNWSKTAVAAEIKKQTGGKQSAKHIARYISQPTS